MIAKPNPAGTAHRHSSGNQVINNKIEALGNTGHWAAISAYDGWDNASAMLQPQSINNTVAYNTIADKGISLGAWAPSTWTSNAGSKVSCNTTTQVGVAYSHGPVLVGGNSGTFWMSNTDNILNITGITYTGTTDPLAVVPATQQVEAVLNANLAYSGSGDGSGIDLSFDVDSTTVQATTTTGGSAGATMNLGTGVYNIKTRVGFDGDCGYTDSAVLVVYDPSGGFVTGGGWMDSPVDAYTTDTLLIGKATFGFVSKYKKGATIPEGNTEFVFQAGNLNLHSTSYEWLVVTGGNYAKFKGAGVINDALAPNGEPYKFQLWAGDGTPDTFRIKIWYEVGGDEVIIYDNGMDQAVSGGSIVVHTK